MIYCVVDRGEVMKIYDYKYNVVAKNDDKWSAVLVISTRFYIVALFVALIAKFRYKHVNIL